MSPIDWLQKMVAGMATDLATAAFSWLQIFLINPTEFSKYSEVTDLFNIVYSISITCSTLFFLYNLLKLMFQKMGGYASRSISEVTMKSVLGTLMATFAPLILTNILININNGIVKLLVAKGITIKAMSVMVEFPANATISEAIGLFLISVGFVFLSIQYVVRLGEIMLLYIFSPICAVSMVNEDMNAFKTWYWESFNTIFTQSFQLSVLWLIMKILTNLGAKGSAGGLTGVLLCLGLMYFLIFKGPNFARNLLYRTGSLGMVRGAVGSVNAAYSSRLLRDVVKKVIPK